MPAHLSASLLLGDAVRSAGFFHRLHLFVGLVKRIVLRDRAEFHAAGDIERHTSDVTRPGACEEQGCRADFFRLAAAADACISACYDGNFFRRQPCRKAGLLFKRYIRTR